MTDKASIYAAFVKAQQEFAPALKSASNPHFKSKYADLSACVEAVIDALHNHGLGMIQRTYPDDTGVTVETVFIHESGQCIEGGKLHVPAAKQDPQGYGSALTYCRRYSLMAACGIAPEDDDGNAASRKPPQQPARAPIDIAPYLATMNAAKSSKELAAAATAAWEATGDERVVEHHQAILAARKAEKQSTEQRSV